MEHTIVLEVGVIKQTGKFTAVAVHHSEVEWPKVHVEWVVDKVIVDIKEVGIHVVGGSLAIGDPVKFVFNNLTQLTIRAGNNLTLRRFMEGLNWTA